MDKLTFNKSERLCGHSLFTLLFKNGKSFSLSPFRVTWMVSRPSPDFPAPVRAAFIVPKRNFKKASQRNRIRRRMKEAYRLHKSEFILEQQAHGNSLIFTCYYSAREECVFGEIENKIIVTLQRLGREINGAQVPPRDSNENI